MESKNIETVPLALSVKELMQILRIGRNSAYQLIRSGQIPCVRIGRSIRIPRDAVIAFLERETA